MPDFSQSAETSGIETMFRGNLPEFCGRLSRGLKAHFVCNKFDEYNFDDFLHVLIFLPLYVHNWHWGYFHCRSPETTLPS